MLFRMVHLMFRNLKSVFQIIQSFPSLSEEDIVKEAVSRCHSMTPDAAAAELLWLSAKYPTTLLKVLLRNLDVDKG